ncbi:MAG TPA: hypothetical protein VJQ47_13375 [Steroidobacteraceae bacterium]|nr:hypothetical protein [Steroidobacteraceae bacterium]
MTQSHHTDRLVPGLTLAEIAKSELPLPDRESLTKEEQEAFDYVLERSKRWFKSTSSTSEEDEYRMSPFYQGLLQSPLVAGLWVRLTDAFGSAEARGSFSVREREWIRVVVPPMLANVPIHGLQIADAVAAGIAPQDIKAILDNDLTKLAPGDRQLVDYIRAVVNGESNQELFKAMAARMGTKGACEYAMSVLFIVAMRRGVQAMWAAQGIRLRDPSTDYATVQSYIDGTATVQHRYDRLGDLAKGSKPPPT